MEKEEKTINNGGRKRREGNTDLVYNIFPLECRKNAKQQRC